MNASAILALLKSLAGSLAPEVQALIAPYVVSVDAHIAASAASPDWKFIETQLVGIGQAVEQFELNKLAAKV